MSVTELPKARIPYRSPGLEKIDQFTIQSSKFLFAVFSFHIKHVCTIEPHPSSKSKSDLASVSRVAMPILAAQRIAKSLSNEKAIAQRESRPATKVTGSTTSKTIKKTTLPFLQSTLQGAWRNISGLNLFPPHMERYYCSSRILI